MYIAYEERDVSLVVVKKQGTDMVMCFTWSFEQKFDDDEESNASVTIDYADSVFEAWFHGENYSGEGGITKELEEEVVRFFMKTLDL